MIKNKKNIVVIGGGNVGSHIISASIHKNLKANFILVDICDEFEKSQVLDLKDTLPFSKNTTIESGDLSDNKVKNSDIFIITAGVKQKVGDDRISLLAKNIEILKKIKKQLGEVKKTAIVIVVSNPVDLLTKKASDIFKLKKGQVFGTGTLLDSARLQWHLSELKDEKGKNIFSKNPEKIKAYVLGEHGDSSFVCWSQIKNHKKVSEEQKKDIEQKVRNEAYKIIEGKGSTYFGIGAATASILTTVVKDEKRVLPLSTELSGEYGQKNIAIGVLAKVGKKGIIRIIEKKFSESEKEKFNYSIEKIKKFL